MFRWPGDRGLPGYAEPAEVLIDSGDELLAATAKVDVRDAVEKSAAEFLGELETDQRRERLAQAQAPIWARCEAEDRLWHG